jgi:hypothetical protein
MSLQMDKPAAKTSNFALFSAVLHSITSCSEFVAREIDYAQLRSGKFSHADRGKLKRTADGLLVLGLLARIIGQTSRIQEQTPIRGERSVNVGPSTKKYPSIIKDEEHAITPKPHGGALA